MTNENGLPERIWVCTHLGEYGHYYPEAVEAEGEWGGVAVPYVPETISDAKDAQIRVISHVAGEWRTKAIEAADRIADLETERDKLAQSLRHMVNHAGQLEINDGIYWEATEISRKTLAEIQGNPNGDTNE